MGSPVQATHAQGQQHAKCLHAMGAGASPMPTLSEETTSTGNRAGVGSRSAIYAAMSCSHVSHSSTIRGWQGFGVSCWLLLLMFQLKCTASSAHSKTPLRVVVTAAG